jgi:hypothetical protein
VLAERAEPERREAGDRRSEMIELLAPSGDEEVSPTVEGEPPAGRPVEILEEIDGPVGEADRRLVRAGPPVAVGDPARAGEQRERRDRIDQHDRANAWLDEETLGDGHAGEAGSVDHDPSLRDHRHRTSFTPGVDGVADLRVNSIPRRGVAYPSESRRTVQSSRLSAHHRHGCTGGGVIHLERDLRLEPGVLGVDEGSLFFLHIARKDCGNLHPTLGSNG